MTTRKYQKTALFFLLLSISLSMLHGMEVAKEQNQNDLFNIENKKIINLDDEQGICLDGEQKNENTIKPDNQNIIKDDYNEGNSNESEESKQEYKKKIAEELKEPSEFDFLTDKQRNYIVQNYRKQFKDYPALHTGSSLAELFCEKISDKKTVYLKNEPKFRSIIKYFKSRCDYTIEDELSPNIDFIYTGSYSQIKEYYKPGKIVSKIPSIKNQISEKAKLKQWLIKLDKQQLYDFTSTNFRFRSFEFNLNTPIYSNLEQYFMLNVNDGYWITKKPINEKGSIFKVYQNPQTIKDLVSRTKYKSKLQEYEETIEQFQELKEKYKQLSFVEQYMADPFLYNNKKVDHRGFVLIASLNPLVVLYQDGFVKSCIENYKPKFKKFDQEAIYKHITNKKYFKQHPLYQEAEDDLILTVPELKQYLIDNHQFDDEKFAFMQEQKHKIVAYTITAIKEKFPDYQGAYQLMGFDYIFDNNFKIKMIDFNTFPELSSQNRALQSVYPQLVQTTLDLVLDTLSDPSKTREQWEHPENLNLGNWEIVINEAQNYNVLDKYKKSE